MTKPIPFSIDDEPTLITATPFALPRLLECFAAEQVAAIKAERDAAYTELRKQKCVIQSVFDREVWIKVDAVDPEWERTHAAIRARAQEE